MTEQQISDLLAARFSPPDYCYLPQVRHRSGSVVRRADGLAMSLHESRGLFLHGFEIKCSRSDWIAELKRPDKADLICKRCDYWWVVAASRDIVRKSELPDVWGLLVYQSGQLATVVKAPRFESPRPLSRRFLASIMRRVQPAAAQASVAFEEIDQTRCPRLATGDGSATDDDSRMLESLGIFVIDASDDGGILIQCHDKQFLIRNWRQFSIGDIAAITGNVQRMVVDCGGTRKYLASNKYIAKAIARIAQRRYPEISILNRVSRAR